MASGYIELEIKKLLANDPYMIDFYDKIMLTDPIEERLKIMVDESNTIEELDNIVTTYNKIVVIYKISDQKYIRGLQSVFTDVSWDQENEYHRKLREGKNKIIEYILEKFDPNDLLDPGKNIFDMHRWLSMLTNYFSLFLDKGLDVNKKCGKIQNNIHDMYTDKGIYDTIGEKYIEIISRDPFEEIYNPIYYVIDNILLLIENMETTSRIFCSLTKALLLTRYYCRSYGEDYFGKDNLDKTIEIIRILLENNYDDKSSMKKIFLLAVFLADHEMINYLAKYKIDTKNISDDVDKILKIEKKKINHNLFRESLENVGINSESSMEISSKIIAIIDSEAFEDRNGEYVEETVDYIIEN